MSAIVVTPVKDSIHTTQQTIKAIAKSQGDYEYFVFNDFSQPETKQILEELKAKYHFSLIHVEELTSNPSPNYKLVLKMAQNLAIEKNLPLIIVESDVVVESKTFIELLENLKSRPNAGVIGAITVNQAGDYNFPYNFEKIKSTKTIETSHSLSFCCTLLSLDFLKKFDFETLPIDKDWYDVFISRQSNRLGYKNYLAKGLEVLHMPHSSRPWKNLKYKNPLLYYFQKYFYKRDRI